MNDIPIKTPTKDFPVENSKPDAAVPKVEQDTAPVTPATNGAVPPVALEKKPDADQDAVDEQAEEQAARFIMDLPEEDFKSLKIQKTLVEEALTAAQAAQAETFRRQVIANMMQAAYNSAWQVMQQKHGLPNSLDVDWATGATYRKHTEH